MTKKFRIKSRVRFVAFVLICLFAVTGLFNTATGLYNASGLAAEPNYITVEVCDGDTLWDIADQYMPDDMDTREAVYIIKEMNDISSDIHTGQMLMVPEYI